MRSIVSKDSGWNDIVLHFDMTNNCRTTQCDKIYKEKIC